MPSSVCKSTRSSGATRTTSALVPSANRIGTSTNRARTSRMVRSSLPAPPALSFPGIVISRLSILRSAACQGRQGRHHEFVGRGRDTHLPAKIDDATAQPAEFKRLYGYQIVKHGGQIGRVH